ncbi:MAG: dipeptidyl aminopeptidase, partial [Ignavibacteria bacterium GWB2_35_6b]
MKQILFILTILLINMNLNAQTKRPLTVDDMWAMKRVLEFDVSPDGKTIALTVQEFSFETNKGNKNIWLMNSDGSNLRVLKNSEVNESTPKFIPDGKKLSFIKGAQIWMCDLDGNNEEQLTDLYTGVDNIVWSNDGKKLLFASEVYPDCATQECNKMKDEEKAKEKAEYKVYTDLMMRHWDSWRTEKRSHLFLLDVEKKNYIDLTLHSNSDVPPLALGSANDFSFSPDGNEIAFTMNTDKEIATSTNNDIFIINVKDIQQGKETPYKKISGSAGNDNQPVYSPDGKYIAFTSMERAGLESDKQRLALYNRETGELKYVSQNLDISFGGLAWSEDSKHIYYDAAFEIYNSIYKINVETGENNFVLKERVNANATLSGSKLYFRQQQSRLPYEIFSINIDGTELKQLTFFNKNLLDKIEWYDIETFWAEGAEGAKVQSILVKPPFFDETKKYPFIYLIHGGPQGHWNDDFHYRWNLQMFAAKGYVVIAPNPRGSFGYGQEFTDGISQDWGGKVYVDIMNTLDYALQNYKFIDENNLFSAGASYGGYMMNWI